MSTPRMSVMLGGLGVALIVIMPFLPGGGASGHESGGTGARPEVIAQREGPTTGLWIKEDRSPAFSPDQLIVKYRDSVNVPVDWLLARGGSFRSVTTDASDSLDQLHGKFGARSARPVFRSSLHDKTALVPKDQATVRRLQAEKFEAALRRFPQRAARAITREPPDLSHIYVIALAPGSDVEKAAAEFRADPHVAYAHPNFRATAQFVPNDPYYQTSGSWGQPYQDLWALRKLQTESAWDRTQGDGIVVAVVDTGIDSGHPDIAANVWTNPLEILNGIDDDGNGYVDDVSGWDFAYGNNDTTDRFGHGTHVSGTIAAVGNNSLGIIGVAPRARVMAVKGLDDNGSGSFGNLAAALLYAAQNGADVISNSWGCPFPCPSVPVVEDAVRTAHALGAVVVFAAGNSSSDVFNFSPQNAPQVMTVAASTNTDAAAFFSNFGAGLDLAAPGAGDNVPPPSQDPFRSILSLKATICSAAICPSDFIVGGGFLRQAGTSMAAPHVSGVAALVLAAQPSFTVEQVRQAIRRGSDDVGSPGFDDRFGYGRLNAAGALAEISPLQALITTPTTAPVSGVSSVEVRGVASGPGFSSYKLEYGTGTLPAAWTTITTSTSPVATEGTLTVWDVSSLRDGVYTLRLSATNASGQIYEDRQRVTIDQIVITDPPPGRTTAFRGGDVITISGTVSPAGLSHYAFVVQNRAGVSLTNANITLTNGGQQRIVNGVLGSWNTTGVMADYYTITLQVTLTDGSVSSESTPVIVDPTLHPGWPKNLGLTGSGLLTLAITDHLDAADVNRDGRADLLVGYGNVVTILDHTGAALPGWPQSIDPQGTGDVVQKSPAVGDLTGDGQPEVVVATNNGRIFVWSSTGVLLPGWPLAHGGGPTSVAIADINGDGRNDLVTTDWSGRVDVLNASGASLPGWPRFLDSGLTILSPPVVGDIDGDGRSEIAVLDIVAPSNLYLLASDGTIRPGWPRAINPSAPANSVYYSYPAMGELDGDPYREIVVGSGDGHVYALNHDGTDVPGWPQVTAGAPVHSPAIGDLDGDGWPEVVVGLEATVQNSTRVNLLYAWHQDGTLLPGWPVRYDGPINNRFFGFGAAALVDLDGSGKADVTASSEAIYPLSAYDLSGTALAGFPKPTINIGAFAMDTPAVADLDGNGLLEMAWIDLSGNLYVWDLQGPRAGARPWPMFHHDALHTGRTEPSLVLATSDFRTLAGSIISGSYLDTHKSDDIREGLQTAKFRGTTQLIHTWRVDNVPASPHSLVLEAFRPANSVGDNFQFSYSADNVSFTSIPGAIVNSGTETQIEVPFGPGNLGRAIYIRVNNTVTSGSKNRSLYVDFLAIKTLPSTGP